MITSSSSEVLFGGRGGDVRGINNSSAISHPIIHVQSQTYLTTAYQHLNASLPTMAVANLTSSTPTQLPRTVLGPLTSIWTPPASCSVPIADGPYTDEGRTAAYRDQTCATAASSGIYDASQCWPPTAASAAAATPPFLARGFYSPGLVCPSGYSSACTAVGGSAVSGWTPEYTVAPMETAVGC